MIQQQAFSGAEKMLKGCLHVHTTRSDGSNTPEEVIRYYHAHGYDFLALTDHRIYNYQNFAPEIPITILPGMEHNTTIFGGDRGYRCFHTVCIGPSAEDGNGFRQDAQFDSIRVSGQEEYQPYLDEIHAKKNLTIYCHPQWSSTPPRFFEKQEGNFAMEIWNTGCAFDSDMDTDAPYWDEILGQGKRIYGVATDDGHLMSHYGNGWVMVRAENNLSAILHALENGAFYSSCGPEIYNFYVDGATAVVECAPAAKIRLHSDMHPTKIQRSDDGSLTRAEFHIADATGSDYAYHYIRASIIDANGKHAWTNPIFLDSLRP